MKFLNFINFINLWIKLSIGAILGTIGHEAYHFYAGVDSRLVFASYGVGIRSKNGSSELTAYLITFTILVLWSIMVFKNEIRQN